MKKESCDNGQEHGTKQAHHGGTRQGRARGRSNGGTGSGRICVIRWLSDRAGWRRGGIRGGGDVYGEFLAEEAVARVRAGEEIAAGGGEGDFCRTCG